MSKLSKIIFLEKTIWSNEHEEKKVKRGFARWLLKTGQAILSTERSLSDIEQQRKQKEELIEQKKKEALVTAEKLNGLILNFELKKDNNKIFGSVNCNNVIRKLNENGFLIKKHQIANFKIIKLLGETELKVHLGSGVSSVIKVIIC